MARAGFDSTCGGLLPVVAGLVPLTLYGLSAMVCALVLALRSVEAVFRIPGLGPLFGAGCHQLLFSRHAIVKFCFYFIGFAA